ncbi:MAG: hypothetical protein GY940_05670, partial [bacterium]|nr:hypothetical protein [bacterium]
MERIQEKNEILKKDIRFALTTNGTLLTDEMLEFFSRHQFSMMLSFDGLVQDLGRKKGTLEKMVEVTKRIQRFPEINFEINSVFMPQTIEKFSESLGYMIEQGSPEITFDLASTIPWSFSDMIILRGELERLSDYLVNYYRETGEMPVKNFQFNIPAPCSDPGPSTKATQGPVCGAGKGHMSVTPEGTVWGCFMFHDYFKVRKDDSQYNDYSFGTLTDFIANYKSGFQQVNANYADLRQEH